MKKALCFLLVFSLLLGCSPAFAAIKLMEDELDPRLTLILPSKALNHSIWAAGGIFAEDGSLILQQYLLSQENASTLLIRQSLNGVKLNTVSVPWEGHPKGPTNGFIAQDPNGLIYTNTEWALHVFNEDLEKLGTLEDLPLNFFDNYKIDTLGKSLLITRQYNDEGQEDMFDWYAIDYIAMAVYDQPQDSFLTAMTGASTELLSEQLGRSAYIVGADFAQTEDRIFVLYFEPDDDEGIAWQIAEFQVGLVEGQQNDELAFALLERFALEGSPADRMATAYAFDGTHHQVVFVHEARQENDDMSQLIRYNKSGMESDRVLLPGQVYHLNAQGETSLVSINGHVNSGHYLMTWTSPSPGRPQGLITERTHKGKTLAVFRDKGYGLLRKDDEVAGKTDYLAPLRTEAAKVSLRIPLEDLVAKLDDEARNLVILYGEERIAIPMTSLDVRALLDQMPCETDAAIELHLNRLEDGAIQTAGELLVVEQVDEMTKRVHRLPIPLP